MVAAVMADRPRPLKVKSGHSSNDIEPGFPLEADRLKGESVIRPSDQAICRAANADSGTAGNADIAPVECARPDVASRREDGPTHC